MKVPSKPLHLPPGTPAWMTPALINETLETWQPYYDEELTMRDAIEILRGIGMLSDILEKNVS